MTLQQIQIQLKNNNIAARRAAWPEDEYLFQGGGYIMRVDEVQNMTLLNILETYGHLNNNESSLIKVGYHIDKIKIKEDVVEYVRGWRANTIDEWADDYIAIELPKEFVDSTLQRAEETNKVLEEQEQLQEKLEQQAKDMQQQLAEILSKKEEVIRREQAVDQRETEFKAREERAVTKQPETKQQVKSVKKDETKTKTETK